MQLAWTSPASEGMQSALFWLSSKQLWSRQQTWTVQISSQQKGRFTTTMSLKQWNPNQADILLKFELFTDAKGDRTACFPIPEGWFMSDPHTGSRCWRMWKSNNLLVKLHPHIMDEIIWNPLKHCWCPLHIACFWNLHMSNVETSGHGAMSK